MNLDLIQKKRAYYQKWWDDMTPVERKSVAGDMVRKNCEVYNRILNDHRPAATIKTLVDTVKEMTK